MEIESLHKIKGGICAIEGVRANGIKEGKKGLTIILCDGETAGVFTNNKIKAAPVILTEKNLLSTGRLKGIIANSGSANAFTGKEGYEDAVKMARLLAEAIDSPVEEIGVASTGVIGERIDFDWIQKKFGAVFLKISNTEDASKMANRGIMTTDTREKEFAIEYKGVKIGGIAKGSGMIAPDMATMLSFIYTDAKFSSKVLRRSLMRAVDKSFNMLSIDGDTSTNDTVLLTATGDFSMREEDFQRALDEVCLELARKIALDGEGATKYVEVRVKGAKKREDARIAAKSVVNSSLVKTAIFGGDPNWGRIIAALGYSGAEIDGDKISLFLGNPDEEVKDQNTVILNGEVLRLDEERFREILSKDKIIIEVDLGLGRGEAISFGCDLSYDYVKINGAYRT